MGKLKKEIEDLKQKIQLMDRKMGDIETAFWRNGGSCCPGCGVPGWYDMIEDQRNRELRLKQLESRLVVSSLTTSALIPIRIVGLLHRASWNPRTFVFSDINNGEYSLYKALYHEQSQYENCPDIVTQVVSGDPNYPLARKYTYSLTTYGRKLKKVLSKGRF